MNKNRMSFSFDFFFRDLLSQHPTTINYQRTYIFYRIVTVAQAGDFHSCIETSAISFDQSPQKMIDWLVIQMID